MDFRRIRKLPGIVWLGIWTALVCVVSCTVYGFLTHKWEDKVQIAEEISIEDEMQQEAPFRGSNIYTYMELLEMPVETAFENIRVMITNKENGSIFYDLADYENVKQKMAEQAYRGKVIFQRSVDDADRFVVINELSLEEYLYGVVPSEMPSSYPEEALKAQAICARTYAVIHMMNPAYPAYSAHVNDTTAYQVYHNIEEQESTNKAVDETAGMLLFEENGEELTEVYYYSTSCGQASEVSTNVEFKDYISKIYKNDVESSESWYRWTCNVSDLNKKEMLGRMQSRYKANPGRILTMTGTDKYESQPVEELKSIKELFISKRGAGGVGEELIITTKKNTYKIIGEYNIRYVLNDPDAVIRRQDGSETNMATLLPSAFISLEAVKEMNTVIGYHIIGGGYGHGIGMSQNGAKGLANLGYSAEDILAYFFPGAQISEKL